MARGFESKSVADQQASAFDDNRGSGRESVDPVLSAKRRKLELARASVLQQLEVARADPHKEMLRRALAALDRELVALSSGQ
jgi:hypothetical protein